jgi:hypothetical protein
LHVEARHGLYKHAAIGFQHMLRRRSAIPIDVDPLDSRLPVERLYFAGRKFF